MPIEKAREMNAYVTNMAKEVGLIYNFDMAVVANSFDAHRFSHFAKTKGLQDAAEELLFAAYFTEGKNTADHNTLTELGKAIGLDANDVREMLATEQYADEVHADIQEATQVGVSGVPFFVFINKYAVSGAQDSSVFLQALNQVWQENGATLPMQDGAVCTPDGCD
jgi:predicted DsbA family dithiol-disulfide isomerase